jgi:hypothetical protein
MKSIQFLITMFFFVLVVALPTGIQAQSYFSKPEAVKNLADESKKLNQTMEQYEDSNPALYQNAFEKQIVVKHLLRGLKHGKTVSEVSGLYLGNAGSPSLVYAGGQIILPSGTISKSQYFRDELLYLISY